MKNLLLLVGKSGSGKTYLAESLESLFEYRQVSSYTTRPRRYDNETGHVFVTEEEFDQLGELCGYTVFNGYRYGVPNSVIDNYDIYVIDPAGVEYFKKHYTGARKYIVVYLDVNITERVRRMAMRSDSDEAIIDRLVNDEACFKGIEQSADRIFAYNHFYDAGYIMLELGKLINIGDG